MFRIKNPESKYLTVRVYAFRWGLYVDRGDDWFHVKVGPLLVGIDW